MVGNVALQVENYGKSMDLEVDTTGPQLFSDRNIFITDEKPIKQIITTDFKEFFDRD